MYIEPDDVIVYRYIKGRICDACCGHGARLYPNTATYHPHQIAGHAMTSDVCNICWGSGDVEHPWPSHLEFYQMKHRLRGLDK